MDDFNKKSHEKNSAWYLREIHDDYLLNKIKLGPLKTLILKTTDKNNYGLARSHIIEVAQCYLIDFFIFNVNNIDYCHLTMKQDAGIY